MKKLLLAAILFAAAISGSCSKDDGDNGNSPALPSLPDPNDVCSCMTNTSFIKYCYENFDLNGDGAISKTEAAVISIDFSLSAVGDNPAPLTGIEYFPNIQEIRIYSEFLQSKVDIDLRHNKKLQYISLNLRPSGEGEIRAYIPETYEGNKRSDVGLTYCSQIYGKHASSDHRCWIVDGKLTDAASHGLTTYTIPDNVTTIGNWAFSYCKSLESVTIPKNVASIESGAFSNGSRNGLTLYCKPTTPPKFISNFFSTYIAKIHVPQASVEAYKSADGWSEFADKIEGYDF